MMELTVGELPWSGRRGRRAGVAGRGRANLLRGVAADARPRPQTQAQPLVEGVSEAPCGAGHCLNTVGSYRFLI